MKIILIKDVKGLGKMGDIVDVNSGHAMNVYMPKGIACEATDKNISKYKNMKTQKEENIHNKEEILISTLNNLPEEISVTLNANEKGVLFKKLREADVLEILCDIVKGKCRGLNIVDFETITSLGDYSICIQALQTKRNIKLFINKK